MITIEKDVTDRTNPRAKYSNFKEIFEKKTNKSLNIYKCINCQNVMTFHPETKQSKRHVKHCFNERKNILLSTSKGV